MDPIFTKEEQDAISDAVSAAEKKTSGEIVPFVVRRSAPHRAAYYRGVTWVLFAMMLVILLLSQFYAGWNLGWIFTPTGIVGSLVVVAVLAALAVRFLPVVGRWFAGADALTEAVASRSSQAFLDEEVFMTRERTGILIFVSLYERRVHVIGDSGINSKVKAEDWGDVVADILEGIKENKMANGLVSAIERCGRLLESHGVEIRDDDSNELSDGVRTG